jgi:outer membrane lipoprotein SlyB
MIIRTHSRKVTSALIATAVSATLALPVPSMAGPVGKSAVRGAIAGAVIAGIASEDPAKGAAIGAGVGAVAGAIKKNNRRDKVRHRAGKGKRKHRR